MKNHYSLVVAMAVVTASVFTMSSCDKDDDKITMKDAVFLATDAPLGKSYEEWSQDFWRAVMTLDCEEIFKIQRLDLDENVVTVFGPLADTSIEITITRDQYFYFPLITSLWDYPCPDTAFMPAQGQSLEDFLKDVASSDMDEIANMQAVLDGVEFDNLSAYRFLTDLYYFTGNPELADCWDPCITGESQAAVTDGYFLMFKNLKPGKHTLDVHGEWPAGNFEWDVTIIINVQ